MEIAFDERQYFDDYIFSTLNPLTTNVSHHDFMVRNYDVITVILKYLYFKKA